MFRMIVTKLDSFFQLAYDYGGPRKEFFRLVLIEIKEKYFDDGIRDLLASEYRTVGKILGKSLFS